MVKRNIVMGLNEVESGESQTTNNNAIQSSRVYSSACGVTTAIAAGAILSLLISSGISLPWGTTQNNTRLRTSNNRNNHDHDRRRLQLLGAFTSNNDNAFHDPKTVVLRSDNSLRSHFPFGFSSDPKACVDPEEVSNLASTLRLLYEQHGIRAFPRNGFLLGIIRHGGFLPNEDVPDADISIVFEDVARRMPDNGGTIIRLGNRVCLATRPTEDDWSSWKGIDPVSGETYPFFGVRVRRAMTMTGRADEVSFRTNAVYRYRDGSTFFYPRLNHAGYNYKSHLEEMLRYNQEGADYRLLDSDEPLTRENNRYVLQIGNDLHTDLECMTLVQFYFTEVYVPCNYEDVIVSFYGRNWNRVEGRAGGGKGNKVSEKLPEEIEEQYLRYGPKPLCEAGVQSARSIYL